MGDKWQEGSAWQEKEDREGQERKGTEMVSRERGGKKE
jgi:hypothetical protein